MFAFGGKADIEPVGHRGVEELLRVVADRSDKRL